MTAPPRLIVNYATNDLEAFEQVAEAASALAGHYSLRMVVNHLAKRDDAQRTDPGDPYLQYSVNFPGLFQFVAPRALQALADESMLEANLRLAEQKLAVLRRYGIRGAFLGREPVFQPEPVYQRFPDWRGPRVDSPRRSRNPAFALCLHQPEVQATYREAVEGVIDRLPEVDTFYWWTNDSGAGFCWYPQLYPGVNGPSTCRDLGPTPAMAAFHGAVLDGARAKGVTDPMSIMTHTDVWDDGQLPPGSYRYDASASRRDIVSVRADLSLTYPIRYLWDPIRRLEQIGAMDTPAPVAVVWWLSDIYHRTSTDVESVKQQLRLWGLAIDDRAAIARLRGRLAFLGDFAREEFGSEAAEDVVDGWISLHEAFATQLRFPAGGLTPYLPTYGAVSHRWLTRPMVPFPAELSPDEEAAFLPHVFALGDELRRANLLDLHGYPIADRGDPHDLYTTYQNQIGSALVIAAGSFERASRQVTGRASAELALISRAARLMAAVWRSCRNWIEFAILREQAVERPAEDFGMLQPNERARAEEYRQRLHAIMRDELDNILAIETLLDTDTEGVVARGGDASGDEDTFTLAPDLGAQLSRRREIMVAHWQDAARLFPVQHDRFSR